MCVCVFFVFFFFNSGFGMDSHGLGMDSARNLPLLPSLLLPLREEGRKIGVGVVGVVFPSAPNNGRFSSRLGKAGPGPSTHAALRLI